MYCFSRIRVDGKFNANLEHAIEKGYSDKLIECIPDIGLACITCNQAFKRIGERKRRLLPVSIDQFDQQSKCSIEKRKQCTVACKALRELQKQYSKFPDAQIILQPMGIKGVDSGEELALQYNVLHMEFEPANEDHTYSDAEKSFIGEHMKRFRLNDPRYRTRQLYDFIRNVVDNQGSLPVYEYNNLVVELFREKLLGRTQEEVAKICESIFVIMFQT